MALKVIIELVKQKNKVKKSVQSWHYFLMFLALIGTMTLDAKEVTSDVHSTETVRVGLVEYPPHLNFNGDVANSKLYQYIEKTFNDNGFNVQFIKYPINRGKVELEKGFIDLLLPYDDIKHKVRVLSAPLFHSVPGLCFKKDKFIPILSATHRFKRGRRD